MAPVSITHRVSEAIILINVASAGDQFDAVAETHLSPLGLCQLGHMDAIHLSCLTVLVNNRLLTEAQASIILRQEQNVQH